MTASTVTLSWLDQIQISFITSIAGKVIALLSPITSFKKTSKKKINWIAMKLQSSYLLSSMIVILRSSAYL